MADEKNINESFDVIPDEKPQDESISMDDVMKSAIEDAAAAAASDVGSADVNGESATTVLTADMLGQPEEMATTILTTDMLTQQSQPGAMPGSGPMMPGSGPMPGPGPMMNNPQNGGFNGDPRAAQMMPGSGQMMPGSSPMMSGSGPMMPGSGPMMPGSGPMMPGSGPMMSGSGPMMPGSGPMQQMRVPQPPETAKKSSGGMKVVGLTTMILAILGFAAVLVIYFLFGMPKTDYGSAASDQLKTPVVTTAATEESDSDDEPESESDTEAEEDSESEQDEE